MLNECFALLLKSYIANIPWQSGFDLSDAFPSDSPAAPPECVSMWCCCTTRLSGHVSQPRPLVGPVQRTAVSPSPRAKLNLTCHSLGRCICMGLHPQTVTGVYPTSHETFTALRSEPNHLSHAANRLIAVWHVFPTSQMHRKIEQTGACILLIWLQSQGTSIS